MFMGKDGARFEVVRWLACISKEEGGWVNIKKGDGCRVVMVKTISICVKLSD